MLIVIFACLLSPIVTLVLHALFERIFFKRRPPKSPQNALVKLLILFSICYAAIAVAATKSLDRTTFEALLVFAYGFITTLGFNYAYFHFFNMSETARRIHILVLIYESSKHGNLDAKKELNEYNATKMVQVRIDRMIQMGAIEKYNGLYYTKSSGLALSGAIFRILRPLFYGNSSSNEHVQAQPRSF